MTYPVGLKATLTLDCGHTVIGWPASPAHYCEQCKPPSPSIVLDVLIGDRTVPRDEFIAPFLKRPRPPRPPGRKALKKARLSKADQELVSWIVNAGDDEIPTIAQYMWAHAYYPDSEHTKAVAIHVKAMVLYDKRLEAILGLLQTAENGIIPDKAWYAQYGARAISQEVHGRPNIR